MLTKNKSNTILQLYYGFTLPNNNNDDYIPIKYNKSIIKLTSTCIPLINKLKSKHHNNNVNNLRQSNLYILYRIIKML